MSPASAAVLAEGDFESGDGGWYAYGPGVTADVVDGEFCATVPSVDDGGPTEIYDAAIQVGGIDAVVGEKYVLTYDARSTVAKGITVQLGGDWPDVHQESPTIGTETESFEHTFTFAPANDSTVEPGDVVSSNLGFQIGGNASEITVCLDNVSLSHAETELLPQPTFDGDVLGGWGLTGGIDHEISDGVLCIAQPAGSQNPWDVNLTFNGIGVEEGQNYVLTFKASATPGQTPRVLVGENGGGYRTVLDVSPTITDELTEFSFPFTAGLTFPAESEVGGPYEGQVAFQIGKTAAYEFCLADVSLVTSAAPPPPYEPETGPRVRVNQHGYLPGGPKNATIVTDATEPIAWTLRSSADAVVHSGTTTPAGVDPSSQLAVHTVDFSDFQTEGTDYVLSADGESSHPFDIGADIYQQLRYDALNYFYLARSGIEIDADIVGEAYARDAGHLDVAPNQGDSAVTCLTAADDGEYWSYGDWTCPEGYALDVTGGWYDAGDHGKYVVNGGIAVAQLLSTYERSLNAPSADAGALGDSTLNVPETGNDVADVLDEARWELEWMLSMQVPAGAPLAGMAHHKIHDIGWTGLPLLPSQDAKERRLHRPSTAATLNLAAVAAQGSRLFADIDAAFAAELLAAARTAWTAALATPNLFAPAEAGSNGGGPYDDTDVADEFYWAAAELFVTTGDAEFRDAVLESPEHSADIFRPSGFDWGYVAPLGRMTLATVPNALPGLDDVKASVVAGADSYLSAQQGEAFGTSYTPAGDDYEWGSNSMVVNNQVVLATAYDLTGDERYRDAVLEAMDYLLGRNALNYSFVTGYGEAFAKNQHSRWFANQLEPSMPNPPAGSLAGGPNSTTDTWDPTMTGTFRDGCAPAMCYLDHIQSWASNEITINWNSALSQVASFVADQGSAITSPGLTAPVVTKNPASQSVGRNATATLTAAASGNPAPTVVWQSRKGSGAWGAVAGATGTTLQVKVTKAVDGTQYRAVFSNSEGSATSQAATVSIERVAPTITHQPKSTQVKLGKKAKFKVKAAGFEKPTIQWQRRTAKGTWKNVKGATKPTLKVKATAAKHKRKFRAVVSNSQGSVTSKTVRLTIKAAKPKVTKRPKSVKAKVGKRVTFRVKATGFPAPKVRWQYRAPGGKWRTVARGTKPKLTFRVKASMDGRQYRAVLRNKSGKVTTKPVRLTVRGAR